MFYVYEIRNIENNKVYIGQTNNYKKRWICHKSTLNRNKCENPLLQQDFIKYGLSSFKFTLLEECTTREQAIQLETKYINDFGGIECENIYNCQDNVKQNKSMIQKQCLKRKGLKRSVEFKLKQKQRLAIYNPWSGKHHTIETRKKLSKSHSGDKNAMYGLKGKNHPAYGYKRTEEQKQITRLANLGKRKYSEEFVEILRQDYIKLNSYTAVVELHKINITSVSNLIKYGTPSRPENYK